MFARRFDSAGDPLGDDFRVTVPTGGLWTPPDVTVDGSGNFVVVWQQYDGSLEGIFGQRFDRLGNRVGPEFRVNTHTIRRQWYPSVAAASEGGFVVSWMSEGSTEDNHNIRAQRFQADGLKTGSEIHVTSQSGLHAFPAVAPRGGDRFVVVWHSREHRYHPTAFVYGSRHGDHVIFSDGFETGDTSR